MVKSGNKNREIKEMLEVFLKSEFGDKIKGMSVVINYTVKDNSLILVSENKILANELMLRLPSINNFLVKNGIRLSKLLVR